MLVVSIFKFHFLVKHLQQTTSHMNSCLGSYF